MYSFANLLYLLRWLCSLPREKTSSRLNSWIWKLLKWNRKEIQPFKYSITYKGLFYLISYFDAILNYFENLNVCLIYENTIDSCILTLYAIMSLTALYAVSCCSFLVLINTFFKIFSFNNLSSLNNKNLTFSFLP